MATPPPITVLMAVHNGAATVGAAIESVLEQTVRDFRFLIVDDGSTDDSAEVVRSYSDPRIDLVTLTENVGLTKALNEGLSQIESPLVARMDADDLCHPERFAEQLAAFEAGGERVAVVSTWLQHRGADGYPVDLKKGAYASHGDFVVSCLRGFNHLYHPSVMFRREAVAAVGGYDPKFTRSQDYDLWLRMCLAGYDARVVERPLTQYRVHEGQISAHDGTTQQAMKAKAYHAFLAALSSEADAPLLALYLRNDEAFWERVATRTAMKGFVGVLDEVLSDIESQAGLAPSDSEVLREWAASYAYTRVKRAPRGLGAGAELPLLWHAVRWDPRSLAGGVGMQYGKWALLSSPGVKHARHGIAALRGPNYERQRARQREESAFASYSARLDREKASAEVGAIVLTMEPSHLLDACLEALEGQTLRPSQVEIVRNVSPFSEASMEGLRRIETRYYVSVDDDMILEPTCFERLYWIMKTTPHCAEAIMPLDDPILGRIMGVRMYDAAVLRQLDLGRLIGEKGWERRMTQRLTGMGYCLKALKAFGGVHHPVYLPHEAFWKFRFASEKARYYGELSPSIEEQLEALLAYWRKTGDRAALFGMAGLFEGLQRERVDEELTYDGRLSDPTFLRLQASLDALLGDENKDDA